MNELPHIDDFVGTYADGIVWCNCGWFVVAQEQEGNDEDLMREISDLWGEHAETEHFAEGFTGQ